jgi:hypothetical protein
MFASLLGLLSLLNACSSSAPVSTAPSVVNAARLPTATAPVAATAAQPAAAPVAPIIPLTAEGYLTNASELKQRKQLADQGIEPYASAVEQLLEEAEKFLDIEPRAREELKVPKGSERREREVVNASQGAYILGMAYQLSGDARYAAHARAFIMTWVSTNREVSAAENTPLIVSNNIPAMVWGADLLAGYPGWSSDDRAAFERWLVELVLPRASDRENNWGDWGILLRLTITRYVGDDAGFQAAAERWRRQVDGIKGVGGIAADGHLPEETRRGDNGITYTEFALNAKVAAALIAERQGIDLWNYANPQGGNLKLALDYVAPFVLDPTGWPYYDGEADTSIHPVWEIAYQKWQEPVYARIIVQRRPYGYKNVAVSWTTLTNGRPIQ